MTWPDQVLILTLTLTLTLNGTLSGTLSLTIIKISLHLSTVCPHQTVICWLLSWGPQLTQPLFCPSLQLEDFHLKIVIKPSFSLIYRVSVQASTTSALAPKGIITGVLWGFFRGFSREFLRGFFWGSWETLGKILGDSWMTFGRLLEDSWMTLGWFLDDSWMTLGPIKNP